MSCTGIFTSSIKDKVPKGELKLIRCKRCTLLQLQNNFDSNLMYGKNYGYMSSLNKAMEFHLKLKSKYLLDTYKLKKGNSVLDIGSNDGTFLNFFTKSINKYGCDPTAKKFRKNYKKDIKVITEIFNLKLTNKLKKKFKLITAIAMFYDLDNPLLFCKAIEKILHKDGIFHVEIAYLPDIISKLSFDTFCQEHLTYYSLKSFEYLLSKTNLKIIDYNRNSING